MAQYDALGYKTDIREKQIIAGKNAALDLGNGKLALIQSFQGQYGHTVQPVYEVGSSALYFVNGNPIGAFSYTNLVGKSGWFAGMIDTENTAACGTLKSINITLGKDSACDPEITMNSTLKFEGALLTGISFSVTVEQLSISQTGNFKCGKMEIY